MSLHTNIAQGELRCSDEQSHRNLGGELSHLEEDDSTQASVLSIRPTEEHFTGSPTLEDSVDHSGPVSSGVCEEEVYQAVTANPKKLIVETDDDTDSLTLSIPPSQCEVSSIESSFHSIYSKFSADEEISKNQYRRKSFSAASLYDRYYSVESFKVESHPTIHESAEFRESCPNICIKDSVRLDLRIPKSNSFDLDLNFNSIMNSDEKKTPEKAEVSNAAKSKKGIMSSFRKNRRTIRKSISTKSDLSDPGDASSRERDSYDPRSDEESTSLISNITSTPSKQGMEESSSAPKPNDDTVSTSTDRDSSAKEGPTDVKNKVSKLHSVRKKLTGTKPKETSSNKRERSRLGFLTKKGKRTSSDPLSHPPGEACDYDQTTIDLDLDDDNDETLELDRNCLSPSTPSRSATESFYSMSTSPSSPVSSPPTSPMLYSKSHESYSVLQHSAEHPGSVSVSTDTESTDTRSTGTSNAMKRSSHSGSSGTSWSEEKDIKTKSELKLRTRKEIKLNETFSESLIPTYAVRAEQPRGTSSLVRDQHKIAEKAVGVVIANVGSMDHSPSSEAPKSHLTDDEVIAIASMYNNKNEKLPISRSAAYLSPSKIPKRLPRDAFTAFQPASPENSSVFSKPDVSEHSRLALKLSEVHLFDSSFKRSPPRTSEFLGKYATSPKPITLTDCLGTPSPELHEGPVIPITNSDPPVPQLNSKMHPQQWKDTSVSTSAVRPNTLPIMNPIAKSEDSPALQIQYGSASSSQTSALSIVDNQLDEISSETTTQAFMEPVNYVRLHNPGCKLRSDGGSLGISFEDIDFSTQPADRKSVSSVGSSNGGKNEHLYKILVIGELGTGKTSIIKRYVHQFFSQHYRATIGVDFALKVLNWDPNTVIRLQLWDIAGQERFGNMTRVYYKEAVGAFIVFDVTRAQTFDCISKWKNDLDTKVTLPNGSPIPTVLLANKCDQPKEGLINSPSRMDEYCRDGGYAGWFETSAKENINIDEAAKFLVSEILSNEQSGLMMTESLDRDRFALDSNGYEKEEDSESGCKC